MKKLVYLLILSLCVNGLTGASLPWLQSARAASKTEEKSEKQSDSKSKKEKSEKKTSKDQSKKTGKDSDKSDKSKKKTKVEKEKEYTLDLAKNNQVALSVVLKYTKMDIKLKDVKSIELEDAKDKKRIRWEKDEENEGDYILTVLKDFKELRLRVVTKKKSRLLVLKNGAKDAGDEGKAAKAPGKDTTEDTKAPSEEKQEKPSPKGKKAEEDETDEAPLDLPEVTLAQEKDIIEEQTKVDKEADSSEIELHPVKEEASEYLEEPLTAVTEDAKDGEEGQKESAGELAEPTEEQQEPGEEPAEPTEEQQEPGEEPAEPTEEQQEPGEEQAEPTEEQEKSGEEPATPTGDQEQPGEEPTEPTGEQEEPGEEPAEPAEEQEEPGEEPAEPTGEQEEPGEGQGEPSEEQEKSGEEPTEPTGEQEQTGEEQGESGEEPTEPTGEQEEPGEEQAEPTDEQGEPDDGEGAPGSEDGESPEGGSGEEDEAPQTETGTSIPKEAEAWFKRGTELLWGSLEEVVAQLTGGETVYIQTEKLMLIKEAPTQLLSTVTFMPDGDVFKGSYSVRISTDNPALVGQPALIQPANLPELGEVADLYIWVKLDEDSPEEGEEQGEEGEEPTLVVTVTGFEPSGWSRTQPQFTLSGIPEGKEWSYAAIIYDERIVPIASNVYAPDEEGIFTLRFAMLNDLGDIMAASEQYTLQLDWTAPEVSIEVDEETSYTLNIYATDKASGLDAVSVDKGKTWEPIDEDGYTVTEEEEKTFKAGTIRVRDVAGNVFKSEEEYTVEEVEGEEGEEEGEEGEEGGEEGGGGGGGGGNGSGTPALPHSRGDGEEGADYDALILDLPEGPMAQLTVGGEPMALTLELASAQEPDAPVGATQSFTGRLCHWKDASDDDTPNTLLLEAEIADGLGDAFTYEWHFNGEVYRMLANSGIKYVALKVDDTVAAFPTEGFTGGTRYTELKMQGVSTRKFDYILAMKLNLDPSHVSAMTDSDYSQECDLSILTKVEETNYELSNSPQSMMYFYNVFLGPEDMMDQPFGEYRANA